MSAAKRNGDIEDIPVAVWAHAWVKWIVLMVVRLVAIVAGLVLVPVCIHFARTFSRNRFGEPWCDFNLALYPNANKLGWQFHSIPIGWYTGKWWQRILWLYGNDEDGYYGDRRGWWSDNQGGDERSWWSKYLWAAIRNPANNLSRYSGMYGCLVNQCSIEYWGDYASPDNRPLLPGAHFVIATDNRTGRKYYGYRKVTDSGNGNGWNWSLGHKLKPEHADNPQAPDDAHKGFTLRISPIGG